MDQKENDFIYLDNYFQNFNVLFYGIVCTSLVFFIIVFLNIKEGGGFNTSFQPQEPSWYYLAAIGCLLTAIPAYWLYQKNIMGVEKQEPLQDKLNAFRSASLFKYVILDAGNILALILLFLTKEQLFLVVYAIMLTLFAINRPTPYRVVKDLPLSAEEQEKVRSYRRKL